MGPITPERLLIYLFEVIDKRWKIYRRKEIAHSIYPVLEFSAGSRRDNREAPPATLYVTIT